MTVSDYAHPKCYANTRGGCSERISGEHYVSHALIKLFTFDDPDVTISHNNGLGVRRGVSPRRFVANVLCERHNNGLSDADAAALEFATFLRTIALRYSGDNGELGGDEAVTISGDEFQRWVLKLLLTHAVGGALSGNGEPVPRTVPAEAIDVLLGRAQWPRTWGLCVAADPTNTHLIFDPFSRSETMLEDWWSVQPFLRNGDAMMIGGIVELAGVGFGISLFNQGRGLEAFDNPMNPFWGSIQRPSYMEWNLGGVKKRITFEWSDPMCTKASQLPDCEGWT